MKWTYWTMSLQMINLETKQILWTHQLKSADFARIFLIDYTHDYTGNDIKDIVLIKNSSNTLGLSSILLIDGRTGEERCQLDIALPKDDISYTDYGTYQNFLNDKGYNDSDISTYGVYNDVNHDGVDEYYVTNSKGELYILDLYHEQINSYYSNDNTITYTNENHYSAIDFSDAYVINDINQDSSYDFIKIVGKNQSSRCSLIETNNHQFQQILLDDEEFSIEHLFSYFGDVDGDGIQDLAFIAKSNGLVAFHVFSSKEGIDIANIPCNVTDNFYLSDTDSNLDSFKEVFRINNNDGLSSSVMLYNISNQPNKLLFTSDAYYGNGNIYSTKPAISFYDGSHFMIALFTQSANGTGQVLRFYDLNQTLVKVAQISPIDQLETLGNIKATFHDTDIYFYQSTNFRASGDTMIYPFVYNYQKVMVVMKYTNGMMDRFEISNNQILINSYSNELIIADFVNQLSIANIKDQQTINNQIILKFNDKIAGYVNIYVDNVLVGRTKEDSYTLNLFNGDHMILVGQLSPNGIETTYSVQVHVKNNNIYEIIIWSITVILVIIALTNVKHQKNYPFPKGSDNK